MLLKIGQVAKRLGVSPVTVRNWCKKKILKPIQLRKGLHRRFRIEEVESLIKKKFA
jgi:excisionase family DNA binding protein